MTLTEFLLARIGEDEVRARQDCGSVHPEHDVHCFGGHPDTFRLAECEAKRRIIARLNNHGWLGSYAVRDVLLSDMAQPYADHSDYLQKWKP